MGMGKRKSSTRGAAGKRIVWAAAASVRARGLALKRRPYLPFGAGPRVCLGNHFAYMEAPLVLAVLLRRYRFELLGDDEPEPGATLRPRHGVRVRVHRREHARAVAGELAANRPG